MRENLLNLVLCKDLFLPSTLNPKPQTLNPKP